VRLINPDSLPINKDTGYYPQSVDDNFIYMLRVFFSCLLGLIITAFILINPGPPKVKAEDTAILVDQVGTESSDDEIKVQT